MDSSVEFGPPRPRCPTSGRTSPPTGISHKSGQDMARSPRDDYVGRRWANYMGRRWPKVAKAMVPRAIGHHGSTMTTSLTTLRGGFTLTLQLDRADLLPDRLVGGIVRLIASDAREIRGARVTLVGTETWRYDQTTTDANGHSHTQTRTATEDLPHVPVAILGPTPFVSGEVRDVPFQLPVPSLGPPTFDGTEVRVDWEVRLNVDVPGFDPALTMPVRVLQPTALLRAGVLDVAEFALYPEAAVEADGLRGTIALDPVPMCVGAPFSGHLTLAAGEARTVQEVRLEIRVEVEATVSGGRSETITAWSGVLAGAGSFGGAAAGGGAVGDGAAVTIAFQGTLPDRPLPTIRTPHGRADAKVHVVVAVARARDPHLARDVAICSTTEV